MLFVHVGDSTVAKSPGHHVYHIPIKATNPVMVVYRPKDQTGQYNKTNPNVSSNLGPTTKV